MILLTTSTNIELGETNVLGAADPKFTETLICGVGPVEAALNLTAHLSSAESKPELVINFGLAGAYQDSPAELLDICLAEKEVFGDLGISSGDSILPLDESFAPPLEFILDKDLLQKADDCLKTSGIKAIKGNFVTVNSVSGTTSRGAAMRDRHQAVCENMEGAAVARVCERFSIPLLEVRCVSNMVVDRDDQVWHTEKAVDKCLGAVALIIEGLSIA